MGFRWFAGPEKSSSASTALRGPRLNYLCLQAALRKIFRVEREDEVCASHFGAETECIVLGVGRYFGRRTNLDRFPLLSNEVDERADRGRSNVQALQDFLVLSKDVLRIQPNKVLLFRPAMEQVGARNPAWNVLFPEAGDARHDNVRVHHCTLFSFPRFRQQR